MTVEDVAAAIMHQSTPEEEATGKDKPRRKFADVQTTQEKVDELIEFAKKKLPAMLTGSVGEFKIDGIAEVTSFRAKSFVYLKLLKADGSEPIKEIPENKAEEYESPLTEVEKLEPLATAKHKIILCLDKKYWMPKKLKKPAPAKAPETANGPDTKAAAEGAAKAVRAGAEKKKKNGVKAPF